MQRIRRCWCCQNYGTYHIFSCSTIQRTVNCNAADSKSCSSLSPTLLLHAYFSAPELLINGEAVYPSSFCIFSCAAINLPECRAKHSSCQIKNLNDPANLLHFQDGMEFGRPGAGAPVRTKSGRLRSTVVGNPEIRCLGNPWDPAQVPGQRGRAEIHQQPNPVRSACA